MSFFFSSEFSVIGPPGVSEPREGPECTLSSQNFAQGQSFKVAI